MATRTATLQGEVQWAKLYEHNRDMTGFNDVFVKSDGAYTMDLLVDPSDFKKFKEATKTMIKGSPTDDGRIKVKLKRPHKGPFEAASGAPQVSGNPDGLNIGNGSIATVGVTCYDIKAFAGSVGTRMDRVHIDTLVEYVMEGADPASPPTDPIREMEAMKDDMEIIVS